MSDALSVKNVSLKLSYQLTKDQRVDVLVAVALKMVDSKMPRGGILQVAKAFLVSHTAVSRIQKRLLAGKPARLIIKSKNISNTNAFLYNIEDLKEKILLIPIEKPWVVTCC